MKMKLLAATALAGGLLLATFVSGVAHSASAPALSAPSSPVTLVAHGGMGGGGAMIRGGGRIGGGGPKAFAGPVGPGHLNTGSTWRGDRFASRRFDRDDFASRRFDRDDFHHRHGHFVNGVFVFDVGPGYAYNDCWWLKRRALATGSPYWWNRYELCVGYY
jgi:hypothetical protein